MTNCPETRCLSCGKVGHVAETCEAPLDKRLNKAEQEKVRQEEIRFGNMRDKARQRRADKELEAHTIPKIKSTISSLNGDGAKRKRDGSTSSSDRAKMPRQQDSKAPASGLSNKDRPPVSAPTAPRNGSAGVRPPVGLPPRPTAGPAGQMPRPPGRPGAPPNNGQPMVRKKKVNADDMFVKRK